MSLDAVHFATADQCSASLRSAAKAGCVGVVEQYLDTGVLNAMDGDGFTPLHLAASRGHTAVVAALLRKADVQVDLPSKTGATALVGAAGNGHLDCVQLLLEDGRADPSAVGKRGRGALHGAALYGHDRVVAALLRYRVAVDPSDEMGRTPATDAARKGHLSVLRAFLDARTLTALQLERAAEAAESAGQTQAACMLRHACSSTEADRAASPAAAPAAAAPVVAAPAAPSACSRPPVRFANVVAETEYECASDHDGRSDFEYPASYRHRYGSNSRAIKTRFRAEGSGMTRRYLLAPGMVVQGGADATRPFYKAVRDGEARLVIVNVARRTGEADVQLHSDSRILWLPMTEATREVACTAYLDTYAEGLIAHLRENGTIVVNCQEGLHRSLEFTRQLLRRCEALGPWCERLANAVDQLDGDATDSPVQM